MEDLVINREIVADYVKIKKLLMDSFCCNDDYFVKNVEECKWTISNDANWCIVSYWDKKGTKEVKNDLVVVKKNGKLQIFENGKYTMVICIQCVKVAFIFDNSKRICY